MGFFKWVSRVGAVGGTARWGVKMYRRIRAQYPDPSRTSDMEIFRLMVAMRYSAIPGAKHRAYLEGWLSQQPIGLRSLVTAILMTENGWDNPFDFPDTFRDVIAEELAKSGLPQSTIDGP